MNILIVYATNSGSTYTVATIIRDALAAQHRVQLQTAAESNPADLSKYDAVLFGSPSWKVGGSEGQIQETMAEFLAACQNRIPKKMRFAVFGCGDPDFTFFCQAVDTILKIVSEAGGEPIAEPLKIDGFYFQLQKNTALARGWAEKLQKKLTV